MCDQEHYDVVERFAINDRYLIKNGIKYEIELVNCDARVIVAYNEATDEYEHFHYDDINLDEDEFESPIQKYVVQIKEVHVVRVEVEASSEDEARNIAEQMYADQELENDPVYDHTFKKELWDVEEE